MNMEKEELEENGNFNKESTSYYKIHNNKGEIIGDVCCLTSKDIGRKDILFMPNKGESKSMRSVVELVNYLEKENVPMIEREKAIDFLSDRLRAINEDYRKWQSIEVKEYLEYNIKRIKSIIPQTKEIKTYNEGYFNALLDIKEALKL